MEHWGSYFSRAPRGTVDQKLDLTLRLGLPSRDSRVEDANEKHFRTQRVLELKNARSKNGLKTCKDCGIDETPMWRKGPNGPQTLCNACGLRYVRLLKKEKEQFYVNQYFNLFYQNNSWH